LCGYRVDISFLERLADLAFRVEDSETEMKYLRHGELAIIETVWGHVAGGGWNAEDSQWVDRRIAEFLQHSGGI
jgi:hypothetical protein